MNEPKGVNKKEKVGSDGLTKKERRALKVAEKPLSQDNNVNKNNVQNKQIHKNVGKNTENTVKNSADSTVKNTEKTQKNAENTVKNAENTTENTVKCTVNIVKSTDNFKTLKGTVKITENAIKTTKVETENKNIKLPDDSQTTQEVNTQNSALSKKERRAIKVIEGENVTQENEGKSKAQLRAERRELQEKQRLAKSEKANPVEKTAPVVKPIIKKTFIKQGQVQLFNHLKFTKTNIKETFLIDDVHPRFITLGTQYAAKTIMGSNARCLALLNALNDLVEDFTTPENQEFCRSLETYLQQSVDYLQKCRPLAVSMTNALRAFKLHLTNLNVNRTDDEHRRDLKVFIKGYSKDQIKLAGEMIGIKVAEKICNGDVILTYGCSSLIKFILTEAHHSKKKFRVIVIDSRPLFEGKEMLRKLVCEGIDCSYTLINAASYAMPAVTKVLLGAHALLTNGYVMARTGTAQVALVARAYNKPVLVCCEMYKFCERAQTDSFVYNELGDPESIVARAEKNLTPINLMYDVTPPDLVTAVVTELGFIPCTSVPVVLRIRPTEQFIETT